MILTGAPSASGSSVTDDSVCAPSTSTASTTLEMCVRSDCLSVLSALASIVSAPAARTTCSTSSSKVGGSAPSAVGSSRSTVPLAISATFAPSLTRSPISPFRRRVRLYRADERNCV